MSYKDFIEKAAAARGGNYSKGSLVDLAGAMFNENDCAIPVLTKKGEGYVETTVAPGQDLRTNFVAPILKSFGVDKAEMPKLNDIQTSRSGAESLANFALMLVKEYTSMHGMGRKLTLPLTTPDETVQSLGVVKVEEETRQTTKIVKGADGTYSTQPTGVIVTTKPHYKMVSKNRVPGWQKVKEKA